MVIKEENTDKTLRSMPVRCSINVRKTPNRGRCSGNAQSISVNVAEERIWDSEPEFPTVYT